MAHLGRQKLRHKEGVLWTWVFLVEDMASQITRQRPASVAECRKKHHHEVAFSPPRSYEVWGTQNSKENVVIKARENTDKD